MNVTLLSAASVPPGWATQFAPEVSPPWNLDRIDHAFNIPQGFYSTPGGTCGAGAHLWVIDTGINPLHVEFLDAATGASRVGVGYDFTQSLSGGLDCNGHGTHVSGIAAGLTFGVAKCASLHSVRVLDCQGSGSVQNVISGLAYVASQVSSNQALYAQSVALMSLGGASSPSVNSAVAALVAMGVPVAVAAGNDAATSASSGDACQYSPSGAPGATVVSATDQADARPAWANYGGCVRFFAPGGARE